LIFLRIFFIKSVAGGKINFLKFEGNHLKKKGYWVIL